MAYKVKICNRFNTIEWESEDTPYLDEMQYLYDLLASMKLDGSEKVESREGKPDPKTELATQKQLDYMDGLGIDYPIPCTKKEAWKLINQNSNRNSPKAVDDGIPF